jgi:predicted  nucleic acid-binding Zn-ribbon protein|tara:strand:+ start:51392 stop:51796 length:405 start_codon:yes stop_codon:yes gene_type:complete
MVHVARQTSDGSQTPAIHQSVDTHESIDFINSYREIIDKDESDAKAHESNQKEQGRLVKEIEDRQQKLAALRAEEQRVVKERERSRNDKKRLHESLSERERALLELGMELERRRSSKRARTENGVSPSESGEEA